MKDAWIKAKQRMRDKPSEAVVNAPRYAKNFYFILQICFSREMFATLSEF